MSFRMKIDEFARYLWPDISPAQLCWHLVNHGMPLTTDLRTLWRRHSAKGAFARYSPREYFESILIKGRQGGGSSRIGVTSAFYEGIAVERKVVPGTRLSILFCAPTLRQSTFDQTVEKLRSTPDLSVLVENDAAASGEVRLSNGIDLVNISANPRHARGRAAIMAIVDECAFLRTDTGYEMNVGELLESIRPSLVVHNGKLLLISSPSGREGFLYESWVNRDKNPNVFISCWPSSVFNPNIDPKVLERERRRGESYYQREYEAQFVESANPFLPPESLDKAIQRGVSQLERQEGDHHIRAGIDLADRRDDCAISISAVRNIDGRPKVVLLFAKAWKPTATGHDVVAILEQMGEICRRYEVTQAKGDQKSMSTAEHILGKYGVRFERTITDGSGSEVMYRTFLATVNSGDLLIPEHEELLTQLRRLEERTSDGNRFRVAGRRNSKDDLAVSAVLSVSMAAEHLTVHEILAESIWI